MLDNLFFPCEDVLKQEHIWIHASLQALILKFVFCHHLVYLIFCFLALTWPPEQVGTCHVRLFMILIKELLLFSFE